MRAPWKSKSSPKFRRGIGQLRRSAVVSTYGPGAIVDFRDGEAAVSGIVAGLEEWDRNFPPPGISHPQSTVEPRLMQKLRLQGLVIAGFRLPPVLSDHDLESNGERLIAAEFPHWHQCPVCERIGPSEKWGRQPGKDARYCQICSRGRQVYLVPVRFVMACERGHLEDFPWHQWVGHAKTCNRPDQNDFLFLKSKGSGLAGLRLSCPYCNEERSMEGIFGEETWTRRKTRCAGRRPWLAGADEHDCDETPRALQRGATNLYFPVTESSLDIPPWSDQLQSQLGQFWAPITALTETSQRHTFIKSLAISLKPLLQSFGWTIDRLIEEIDSRLSGLKDIENEDLRTAEYRQFVMGADTPREAGNQFEIRHEPVPPVIAPWLGKVVRAVRLREVRALTGFTRIIPPGEDHKKIAQIAVANPGWLPAIEVFGEGVFLDFPRKELLLWESIDVVKGRAAEIAGRWLQEYEARYGEKPNWLPSARFLLIHTFAHAFMRQLTLDCGYSTASLRERLYVSSDETDMAGVLIYTATSDADGTLGGLQRQGLPDRMRGALPAAIRAMEWCSSDPLCISGRMAAPESASGAACHACVLAPETSCEYFNRLLDRALLVGLPDCPEIGFFQKLLAAN